jgi:hypothetical protein
MVLQKRGENRGGVACVVVSPPLGHEIESGTDVTIFKNIFAEKFNEKICVFDSKQS